MSRPLSSRCFFLLGRTWSDHRSVPAGTAGHPEINTGPSFTCPCEPKTTHDSLVSKKHSLQVAAALDELPYLPTANSERSQKAFHEFHAPHALPNYLVSAAK